MPSTIEGQPVPHAVASLKTMAERTSLPNLAEWATRMLRFYYQGVAEGLSPDKALSFARQQDRAFDGLDRWDPIDK
ncbi:MAG TPA: hypothetical protein VK681_39055 [Reyranella sp.]|nr:hypothetical protein [Reyranella sp.]